MFCKYCGKEINAGEVCEDCKVKENVVEVEATRVEQNTNTNANAYSSNNVNNSGAPKKSKLCAGLLGIFLGSLGVHNFYLGYTGKAVAQLLITILSCFILSWASAIWGLIEGILLLCGQITVDGQGNPLGD